MQGVETQVELARCIAILLANEYLGSIFKLHVGGLAGEHKRFDTEQLAFLC